MRRDLIGETFLNQFRVENFVASGGMATIYRVWDLQRMVPLAMKVLHPELAEDPAFMQRFQREARSLQMLIHPNIVPFYGLYRGDGLTFLLERYVDGPTLDELLRRRQGRPLPLSEALVFFKALYTSLGYAHAQGIIHCDIKPGNVLIDQGGHVYLTDFGIARFLDAAITTSSALGTPLYMAPEQIRGERLSTQTDLYSLGVVMFELFTGQRPFRGDTNIPPGVGDNPSDRIRYEQLYVPAPDPRTLNPTLPEGLARVVQRAMAKDPRERYPSVHALAEEIAQVIRARIETLPDRIRLEEAMAMRPADSAPRQEALPPVPLQAERPSAPPALENGANVYPVENAPADWPLEDRQQGEDGGQEGVVIPPYEYNWDRAREADARPQTMTPWEAQSPGRISPEETLPGIPPAARPLPPGRAKPAQRRNLRWLWLLVGALLLVSLCGLVVPRLVRGLTAARAGLPEQATKAPVVNLPPVTATAAASATLTAAATVTAQAAQGTVQPSPTQQTANFPVAGEIAFPMREQGVDSLYLLDTANGGLTRLPSVPNVSQVGVSAPEWSPDGLKISYVARYNSRFHIVAMNLTEMEPYQVPAGEQYRNLSSPAWLADSSRLTFYGANAGQSWVITADGTSGEQLEQVTLPGYRNLIVWNWQTGEPAYVQQSGGVYKVFIGGLSSGGARLIEVNGEAYAPSWSRDGQWIAFQSDTDRSSGVNEIWVARADGSEPRAVTTTPEGFWSRAPTWSPDGKQIAFVSNRAGSIGNDYGELFVVDLASGQVRQMTNTGGRIYDWRPAWRPSP